MKELKGAARRLLFELGAPVSTKGFTYAVDILCDGVVNQKPIAYKEKIYDRWAEKFGETPYNLERILRYLKDDMRQYYKLKLSNESQLRLKGGDMNAV